MSLQSLHKSDAPQLWPARMEALARGVAASAVEAIANVGTPLGSRVQEWIASRSALDALADYFLHPQAMPLLALPWWLEQTLRGEVDEDFQAALMRASIDGYFFIRMLDDVMDGHSVPSSALPALHLFSLRFHSAYHALFPAGHPFWAMFSEAIVRTAEAESADTLLPSVSEAEFLSIPARKSSAALIPMAAVCYRYGREDILPAWRALLEAFAPWHQMHDDILDWSEDLAAGRPTWLLSEAERRKAADETVAVWIGRSGLRWAGERMAGWMDGLEAIAAGLGSAELCAYLEGRDRLFRRQIEARIQLAALCEPMLRVTCP